MGTSVTLRNLSGPTNLTPHQAVTLWGRIHSTDPIIQRHWSVNGVTVLVNGPRAIWLETAALGVPLLMKYHATSPAGTFDSNGITITREAEASEMTNNDIIEVKEYMKFGEQASTSVLHFRATSVLTGGPQMSVVANTINTIWMAQLTTMITSIAQFKGATAQKILPVPRGSVNLGSAFNLFGTSGAVALPRQDTGLIRWKASSAIGRHANGRTYVPFASRDQLDIDATPNAAYVAQLILFAIAITNTIPVADIGGSCNLNMVLVDRAAATVAPVDGYFVAKKYATQRRRGSYGKAESTPLG